MFFNNQKSRDKEEPLLRKFLNVLDEIDSYLDEYDEIFGLAFNEYDPIECSENLTLFLSDRLITLREEGKSG